MTALGAAITAKSTLLGLLPPALVGPALKVIPLNGADLFGEGPQRSQPYPLQIATPATWQASWVAYDVNNVRVLLTTGVNCPDRGVSRETNVLGKGWPWLLDAGTAKYTGRHWDPAFGWYVVDAVRTGNLGRHQEPDPERRHRRERLRMPDDEPICPARERDDVHDRSEGPVALMKQAGFDVANLGSIT